MGGLIMKTRVRQLKDTGKYQLDNPEEPMFVIDEIVTSQGDYITWSEVFSTRKAAEKHRKSKL